MRNSNIKVTRVEAMNICREMIEKSERTDKADVLEVIDKMIKSLSKKSVSDADKERAAENELIRTAICDALQGKKLRVSDITKAVNTILETDYTSNKVSAQVTVLKNEGAVLREVDKKVAYFSLA